MCGITGFIDFNNRTEENVLRSMTDVLHHRGPDDSGYFYERPSFCAAGLGHRRLSILDLSEHGHQPMVFQNLVLVFNGEIYNFNEIKDELIKKGYDFSSTSDTEVILKAYHAWGTSMLSRFNGMFAFALYDKEAHTVTLFRDRAGVKPLYWYFKDDVFLFASELKSLHQHPGFRKELNSSALALFLKYQFVPEPHTIFQDCFKLKAGHYLTLDLRTKTISQTKYWDVFDYYNKPKFNLSEEEVIDETEKILKSAFNYRMVADVPVGIFLSGGYDSSLVTAILQADRTQRLKTFSIGFHEAEYNEAQYAKRIAEYLGTDHTEYYCTKKDALDIIPQLSEIWDEPFGDASAVATVLVSRLARKGVTVSLSADGGDESFGGYDKYVALFKKIYAKPFPRPFKSLLSWGLRNPLLHYAADKCGMPNAKDRLKRLSHRFKSTQENILSFYESEFSEADLYEFLLEPFETLPTNYDEFLGGDKLDNLLAVDYKTYQLDCILTKVDRATMSVGLEGREPLLDYRIAEFVSRVPARLKIKNGNKKYILKQIAAKYIPDNLLNRPKQGFAVPLAAWFNSGELKDSLLCYLDKERLKREGIFHADAVIALRDRYLTGKKVFWSRIWYLLVFQMWKERWL